MSSAVEQILAGNPDPAAIESFLSGNTFPIVDRGRATFVFYGQADEVNLRHFVFGLPSSQPLSRAGESNLWHFSMDLPDCSRIEYKFERVLGDRRKWILDPLNARLARDPYGANSVCHGEGYETPEWTLHDSEARPGQIDQMQLHSKAFDEERTVQLYLPARFRRRRRYPLLIVHDGEDYLRYAALQIVLDNLIHRQEIAPMIVALTGSADRLQEYAADPRHARFLCEDLVPALESNLPLIAESGQRGLMGASFGGVAGLHAAWKNPGFFGRMLLQSGSFAFSDIGEHQRGPVFDPVVDFMNRFRETPGRPTEKLFVSCGMYESLIYENRSMVPLFQSIGLDLRYVEARDGHNWENWRDRLREALSWLFPGPLWMVYE